MLRALVAAPDAMAVPPAPITCSTAAATPTIGDLSAARSLFPNALANFLWCQKKMPRQLAPGHFFVQRSASYSGHRFSSRPPRTKRSIAPSPFRVVTEGTHLCLKSKIAGGRSPGADRCLWHLPPPLSSQAKKTPRRVDTNRGLARSGVLARGQLPILAVVLLHYYDD